MSVPAIRKIPSFGHAFREKYFPTKASVLVNHGSYGLSPAPIVQEYLANIQKECDFPDKYMRFVLGPDVAAATKEVAELVDCDATDLVFLPNATAGVNTILRSFPFVRGDKVVMPSTVYGSCGNTVKFLAKRIGIIPITIDLQYPLNDQAILDIFEAAFKQGGVRLCLFDAVISMPGVRFPFEKMVEVCRFYDVLSLVDGAHSVGLIPYSLRQIKPDFFVSNLHKWLFVPRGCALLYVDRKHHRKVHTFPISHSYLDDDVELLPELEATRLVDRFVFTGTNCYASIATVPFAIKFRRDVCGGEEAIFQYCHELAKQAGIMVAERWGTSYLDNDDHSLITAMVNVEVPLRGQFFLEFKEFVELEAVEKYGTYVQSCAHNGKVYVRFSCQIYNELSDYETAADVFMECLRKYLKSEHYQKHAELEKVGELSIS
ncbi:hypothetical protein BABINDRAFT_171826 [Babjeviella inositovora NRRL Y-12698]|uniref:Aminotransferase class V domain-containing protein n=1 Tax=Babjeviella inositovora NRRL Y-12698 TaxID=984486 RepID=A0A1E3QMS3_9ASCO|nr:uncharacterized protein BABINDRAFT_171826 [Babjeviella inositovora NRRL Y-12698]ODQ78985.1 hypothetical protein BABINDRAFT_171826 [Babjeviella inositovora NRRL Y-12698]